MRNRRGYLIISWLAVVAWGAVIFWFSSQVAQESDQLSIGLTHILVDFLVSPFQNGTVDIGAFNHHVRKLGHFVVYLILGFLVMNGFLAAELVKHRKLREPMEPMEPREEPGDGSSVSPQEQKGTDVVGGSDLREEPTILFTEESVIDSMMGLRPFLIAWGLCILYAVSDELHQYFVPGRGAQLSDVFLDSLGALAGIVIFNWLLRRLRERVR